MERRLGCFVTHDHPGLAAAAAVAARQLRRTHFGMNVTSHGDFGVSNLLSGHGHLRAIDPAGFAGPAAYDIARYLGSVARGRPGSAITVANIERVARAAAVAPEQLAVLTAIELIELTDQILQSTTPKRPTGTSPHWLAQAEHLLHAYLS